MGVLHSSEFVQHLELLHPIKHYNKPELRNGDKQIQNVPLPNEIVRHL